MTANGDFLKISHNFWKIYAYKFLGEFFLILPVLIPYYVATGLNSSQIFITQAAYAFFVLLLEVPSGYLADVIGRRKTLVLGGVFLPLGMAAYAMGRSFPAFVMAEFLLAIGNSMRSGCDSALIYDSLHQLQRENEYKCFEGRAVLFTRVGTAVSSVAGSVMFVVISPLFGRLSDVLSLSAAFVALSGFFLLAGAPLLASMLRHWQEG